MTEKHSFLYKKSVISVFICLLSVVICVSTLVKPTFAQFQRSVSYEVSVSATVGEPKLTVFGYTSSLSLVQLEGQRVSEQVISQTDGYFYFDRVFLPRPTLHLGYPELCLTSIDTQSRISSFPACLPSLPTGPFEITVGPVLLSPTLSLSKGKFLSGEQIKASGATFPNSKVTVFLADETKTPRTVARQHTTPPRWPNGLLGGEIISKAHARFLPQYELKTDRLGNFEFNLPATRPADWRVFASAEYLGSPSPKSTTLSFQVLSWWAWFWLKLTQLLRLFFGLLRPYWWLIIIFLELAVIAALHRKWT